MEKFSDSLGTQINITARSLRLSLEKNLAPLGVSPSQWMLLMALGEKDHQVQTELAKMIHLDNATITRIIDKLEQKGLLVRNQAADDRRVQIVSLTRAGKTAHRKWNIAGEKVNEAAKENIDNEDIETFFKVIAAIKENLNHHNAK